jgi:uncharacterized membrane protein YcaP (DUF421 family)
MCVRAVVIYVAAWLMVRLVGDRRFAGKYAAIDIILSITLGATLSRAINGSASFFPTLGAGITLVGLHWLVAALTFWLPQLEPWIKGRSRLLVQDGDLNERALRVSHLTKADLAMALRSQASLQTPDHVALASLEPSGEISVIPQSSARIVEISVEAGVQTVRIEIDQSSDRN